MRHRCLFVLISAVLLFILAMGGYAGYVNRSAASVIQAAGQIRTTADAEKQIVLWRQARGFSESRSPDGSGHAYQIRVGNGLLAALRITPKTEVLLEVTRRSGELQLLVLGMYTDRSSVWVQEDFASRESDSLSVSSQPNGVRYPLKTVIMFSSGLDEPKRSSAFALKASCLVKLGGCVNAEEMLPSLRQLGSANQ